nr:hypothetical protein [Skermanella mucosa]
MRSLADVGAGPGPNLDEAGDLQRDHGFAHRRAADAELAREVAFGGQAVARRELAPPDQVAELAGDLLVQPLRLYGLDGQLKVLRLPAR